MKNNHYPSFVFESWDPWREDNEHHVPARKLRSDLFEYIHSIGYKIRALKGYNEIFLASK